MRLVFSGVMLIVGRNTGVVRPSGAVYRSSSRYGNWWKRPAGDLPDPDHERGVRRRHKLRDSPGPTIPELPYFVDERSRRVSRRDHAVVLDGNPLADEAI